MPIGAYYKGSGNKVMGAMKKEYGDKKGKQVFYATANKKGMKPRSSKRSGSKSVAKRMSK